jgi:hypothetical protein
MKFKSTNHFVNYLFEQVESSEDSPNVEFPTWLEDKLKTVHGVPGQGSIFKNPEAVKDTVLKTIGDKSGEVDKIATTTGAIKVSSPGIGYDLVLPMEEASQLPDASVGETEKVEGPNKIKVPMVTTSAPMEQFSTDELTIIVRPKKDASGKILPNEYIILSAFPGKDLPRASEWNGKFAVVVPEKAGEKSQPLSESRIYQSGFDLNRWQKMAGILKG